MTTIEDQVYETREDIPLKKGKKSKWYSCNEDSFSGSKYINLAFGSLTLIITAALLIQIHYGDYQVVPHGSVATDSLECSNVGTHILKQGGNAVDAAIASAFCLAVATPHVTGLDAEGQLLIYSHKTRHLPEVINFSSINVSNNLPRLVLGLIFTHRKYGSLAWKVLVQPAADLARHGHLISKMLVQAITKARAEGIFGRLEPGRLLIPEHLADTLDNIANFSEKDLDGYMLELNQVNVTQALKSVFHDYNIYIPDSPSIGTVLLENLREFERYNFTKADVLSPEYIYKLADTSQITYNEQNISADFHDGTFSNVAVIDTNDNYVSLVTGMYRPFGTGEMTIKGYVLDAKSPNALPNRQLPLIVTDANFICGRRLVFGANDVAVATQMIASLVIGNENATEAVESPRFHILGNGSIAIEDSHLPAFGDDTLAYLDKLTLHALIEIEPYQSTNIVEKVKDSLKSHSDSRGGIASRY